MSFKYHIVSQLVGELLFDPPHKGFLVFRFHFIFLNNPQLFQMCGFILFLLNKKYLELCFLAASCPKLTTRRMKQAGAELSRVNTSQFLSFRVFPYS
jgi:hypothetical protein